MVKFVVLILVGDVKLLFKENMLVDSEVDFQLCLKEGKLFLFVYYMGDIDCQFWYNEELVKMGGFDLFLFVLEMMWDDVMDEWYMNFLNCNIFDYEIIGLQFYCCLNFEEIKIRFCKVENVKR